MRSALSTCLRASSAVCVTSRMALEVREPGTANPSRGRVPEPPAVGIGIGVAIGTGIRNHDEPSDHAIAIRFPARPIAIPIPTPRSASTCRCRADGPYCLVTGDKRITAESAVVVDKMNVTARDIAVGDPDFHLAGLQVRRIIFEWARGPARRWSGAGIDGQGLRPTPVRWCVLGSTTCFRAGHQDRLMHGALLDWQLLMQIAYKLASSRGGCAH